MAINNDKPVDVKMAADIFLKAMNELKNLKKDSQPLFDKLDIPYGAGAFKEYGSIKEWLIEAEKKLAIEDVDDSWDELVGDNFSTLIKSTLSADYRYIVEKRLLKNRK